MISQGESARRSCRRQLSSGIRQIIRQNRRCGGGPSRLVVRHRDFAVEHKLQQPGQLFERLAEQRGAVVAVAAHEPEVAQAIIGTSVPVVRYLVQQAFAGRPLGVARDDLEVKVRSNSVGSAAG